MQIVDITNATRVCYIHTIITIFQDYAQINSPPLLSSLELQHMHIHLPQNCDKRTQKYQVYEQMIWIASIACHPVKDRIPSSTTMHVTRMHKQLCCTPQRTDLGSLYSHMIEALKTIPHYIISCTHTQKEEVSSISKSTKESFSGSPPNIEYLGRSVIVKVLCH